MKITCTCAHCGKEFTKLRCAMRPGQRTFCSHRCHSDAQFVHGLNAAGYRILTVDGKQQYEHRIIMERHLGRKLRSTEHVHHINGKKADNRLCNLTVLEESAHHREHVGPSFDVDEAKRLYDGGTGYKKLSQIFGTARQNIRACFVVRGWHVKGRTKRSVMEISATSR